MSNYECSYRATFDIHRLRVLTITISEMMTAEPVASDLRRDEKKRWKGFLPR